MNKVRIAVRVGTVDGPRVPLLGRDAWACLQLVAAGYQGVTAIERVGPRWSAYVHKLRKAGISIVTVREAHGGPFPGHHARYVLAVPVFVEQTQGVAA
jgi:hypothetical protein